LINTMQRNAAVSSMLQFCNSVTVDREVQLSLLAAALVTACIDAQVPKEYALEVVETFFDASGDLVALERPGRLN
jgi:hypothetical protein